MKQMTQQHVDVYVGILRHLYREEVEAQRALDALCTSEELMASLQGILASVPPHEMKIALDAMFHAINLSECAGFLGGIKATAPPEAFQSLATQIRQVRGEGDWARLESMLTV